MTEREMEDLLWQHSEKFLNEKLKQFERQSGSPVGRHDISFIDSIDRIVVIEIKHGKLPRGAISQLIDYQGMYKARFPDRVVELMAVANNIPIERQLACENYDIDARQIPEKKFRDVAKEVGYVFRSEVHDGPPSNPPPELHAATLVSRMTSQTAKASKVKRKWDEASYFKEYKRLHSSEVVKAAKQLYDLLKRRATKMEFGTGKQGNAMPRFDDERGPLDWINISTNGRICLRFGSQQAPPFLDETNRKKLLNHFNSVDGISLPADCLNRFPEFQLSSVVQSDSFPRLLEVVDWAIQQIENSRPSRN